MVECWYYQYLLYRLWYDEHC